jgi:pimeloyl-ACP methyl ester carboxylesterase
MEELKAGKFGYLSAAYPLDPGSATLVFIHGAGGSSAMWTAQLEGLAERTNAVAIDLPGHGRSDGPGRNTVADYAKAVVEFILAAEIMRPVPVGLSMGGAIVQQLMLDSPELFAAAILISTGAKLKVMPQIFEAISKNYPDYVNMIGKFSASPKTDPALLGPYLAEAAKCKPEIVTADFRACDAFDVLERIAGIDAPVLVISGADDQLTPPKYADFIAGKIVGAKRAVIEAAGHLAPVEKPAEVNQAIIGFLDENGL